MTELINIFGQFGIAGLLVGMLWFERKDRMKATRAAENSNTIATNVVEQNSVLIELVKSTTATMTAVKDEIKCVKHIVDECDTRKRLSLGARENASG